MKMLEIEKGTWINLDLVECIKEDGDYFNVFIQNGGMYRTKRPSELISAIHNK
jgi:hypothetical protein